MVKYQESPSVALYIYLLKTHVQIYLEAFSGALATNVVPTLDASGALNHYP